MKLITKIALAILTLTPMGTMPAINKSKATTCYAALFMIGFGLAFAIKHLQKMAPIIHANNTVKYHKEMFQTQHPRPVTKDTADTIEIGNNVLELGNKIIKRSAFWASFGALVAGVGCGILIRSLGQGK